MRVSIFLLAIIVFSSLALAGNDCDSFLTYTIGTSAPPECQAVIDQITVDIRVTNGYTATATITVPAGITINFLSLNFGVTGSGRNFFNLVGPTVRTTAYTYLAPGIYAPFSAFATDDCGGSGELLQPLEIPCNPCFGDMDVDTTAPEPTGGCLNFDIDYGIIGRTLTLTGVSQVGFGYICNIDFGNGQVGVLTNLVSVVTQVYTIDGSYSLAATCFSTSESCSVDFVTEPLVFPCNFCFPDCQVAKPTCCGDDCVSLTDLATCGSCYNDCSQFDLCCGSDCRNYDEQNCGACDVDCGTGETCCNPNGCKNLQNDEANCGACGSPCLQGDTCCSGDCYDLDIDENNCGTCGNQCNSDQTCCSGVCVNLSDNEANCGFCGNDCGIGITCCFGSCKNLGTDESNCGTCSNQCGSDDTCCSGTCFNLAESETHCGTCGTNCNGNTCCFGSCKNLGTDEFNCGNCGSTCSVTDTCCTGVCKNLGNDESNCGTCGTTCPGAQTCCTGNCRDLQTDEANCGTCASSCSLGQTCCSGNCFNLQTDESNCGTCGNQCDSDETCCSGVCRNLATDELNCGTCGTNCGPGNTCCSGSCKNLGNDESNCGNCGSACLLTDTCCSGVCKNLGNDESNCGTCGIPCSGAQICCTGSCKDLQTDEANCGTCGTTCSGSDTCCSGNCFNLQTDESHCGTCTTTCGTGRECLSGVCRCVANTGCTGGNICCSNNCVDPLNPAFCGSCAGCPNGQNCCSGSCKNFQNDNNNCGSCGKQCGVGEQCSGGACNCINDSGCSSGFICCSNACVNAGSASTCGSCTKQCTGFNSTCCSGTCTNFANANSCGSCANVCAPNQICCGGQCVTIGTTSNCDTCGDACGSGDDLCCSDGTGGYFCSNSDSSQSCGQCGNVCNSNQLCCNGQCLDVDSPLACGSCSNACDQSQNLCCPNGGGGFFCSNTASIYTCGRCDVACPFDESTSITINLGSTGTLFGDQSSLRLTQTGKTYNIVGFQITFDFATSFSGSDSWVEEFAFWIDGPGTANPKQFDCGVGCVFFGSNVQGGVWDNLPATTTPGTYTDTQALSLSGTGTWQFYVGNSWDDSLSGAIYSNIVLKLYTDYLGCCSGVCVSLNREETCGSCSRKCQAAQTCCDGRCVTLDTLDNCGTCGNKCGSGDNLCCNGQCTSTSKLGTCNDCTTKCDSGESCCPQGCTVFGSAQNCGSCSNVCQEGEGCCSISNTLTCVDFTSNSNCGSCGNTCTGGQVCHPYRLECVSPLSPSICGTIGYPVRSVSEGSIVSIAFNTDPFYFQTDMVFTISATGTINGKVVTDSATFSTSSSRTLALQFGAPGLVNAVYTFSGTGFTTCSQTLQNQINVTDTKPTVSIVSLGTVSVGQSFVVRGTIDDKGYWETIAAQAVVTNAITSATVATIACTVTPSSTSPTNTLYSYQCTPTKITASGSYRVTVTATPSWPGSNFVFLKGFAVSTFGVRA